MHKLRTDERRKKPRAKRAHPLCMDCAYAVDMVFQVLARSPCMYTVDMVVLVRSPGLMPADSKYQPEVSVYTLSSPGKDP